jgi:hypothetical protein
MTERETEFAQVIATSGDHAKYNDCAKKLVAYKATSKNFILGLFSRVLRLFSFAILSDCE